MHVQCRNYSEAHIVSKIVQGLHKDLQTTLSIAGSLGKDMDNNDKDQISSLQDTISKAQKLQSDIWKKTILHSALLKEAYKLSPKSGKYAFSRPLFCTLPLSYSIISFHSIANPFFEFATSTDAFAYIRQKLLDLAEEEDIPVSFAAIPKAASSKSSSSASASDVRF